MINIDPCVAGANPDLVCMVHIKTQNPVFRDGCAVIHPGSEKPDINPVVVIQSLPISYPNSAEVVFNHILCIFIQR